MKTKQVFLFAVFSICIFSLKTLAQSTTVVGNGQYISWEEAGSPSNTEHMRIEPGGNVGIGTTNPNFKLHVEGDFYSHFNDGTWDNIMANMTAASGFIKQNGADISAVSAEPNQVNAAWTVGGVGGGFTADVLNTRVTRIESTGGPLNQLLMNNTGFWFAQRYGVVTFEGYSGMTSSTEWRDEFGNLKAVMTNDGKFGVGTGTTVSPAQTLHVNGTARITQSVNVAAITLMGRDAAGDVTEVNVDPLCFCLVYDPITETNALTCGSACNPLRKASPDLDNFNKGQSNSLSQQITDKDGIAVQIKDGVNLVYLNYDRVQSKATFTMPVNPTDGQIITFASAGNTVDAMGNKVEQGHGVDQLTLLPSPGQTLDWPDTILCCGVHFTFKYFKDISRWLLISNR